MFRKRRLVSVKHKSRAAEPVQNSKPKRKPQYTVTIVVEASRLETVTKEANAAFPGAVRSVRKVDTNKSRSDRLDSIARDVQDAQNGVEELRDELQEWYDNLPESFQSGEKGDSLNEAISLLEDIASSLESVDFNSVDFPTMY